VSVQEDGEVKLHKVSVWKNTQGRRCDDGINLWNENGIEMVLCFVVVPVNM